MAHKIVTKFWMKPVPFRDFDWSATLDNYEGPDGDGVGGGPIGFGATESEAILELHMELGGDECPCDRDKVVDPQCCAAGMCVREEDPHPDPCTEAAHRLGCTCRMETSHSASIDPPEPIMDRYCPLHGNAPDPDEAYDRARDDKMMGFE